jgi:hypothetical protein
MAYGHAERNLALIHQLEAETRALLGGLDQLDLEQSAWLQDRHRCWPDRLQPSTAGTGTSVRPPW